MTKLERWILGLIAIALGDSYAAHLLLGDPRPLNAQDCALGLEVELSNQFLRDSSQDEY